MSQPLSLPQTGKEDEAYQLFRVTVEDLVCGRSTAEDHAEIVTCSWFSPGIAKVKFADYHLYVELDNQDDVDDALANVSAEVEKFDSRLD